MSYAKSLQGSALPQARLNETLVARLRAEFWSNPGENVLTPFMGVGSEVYSAVCAGRRGIGMELKASYYRQAEKNVQAAHSGKRAEEQQDIFAEEGEAA